MPQIEKFGGAETLAKVSKCFETCVPEIMGTVTKGVEITLDKDELSLMGAVREKIKQYRKTKNELLKDSGILTALGNEAWIMRSNTFLRKHSSMFHQMPDFRKNAPC